MAADKKSNPSQIAQAVLDVENQAIKVSIVGSDEPGGVGVDINLFQIAGTTTTTNIGNAGNGTQRVVLASDQPTIPVDIQDTSIAVSLNKDEDSVTIYAPNNNTTAIPVSVTNTPSALAVVGAGAAASALRVQLSDESLLALENINVTVMNTALEITNDAGNPIPVNGTVAVSTLPAPLNVIGSGAAASALRVQLADESLSALENINVTVTNSSVEITNDAGNPVPVSGTVTANIGTTNGLALDTSVNSLLKPASTLAAVTTLGSITNTVVVKADTLANQPNALKVDGSAVTQPISGSVSVTGTANVSVTNFPAVQPVSATDLDIRNLTATDVVTVTGGVGQTADVKVTLDGEQVSVSNFPAPLSVSGAGAAASALRVQLSDESLSALENINVTISNNEVEIKNDANNPIPISAASLPLPTGAATDAKQDTIIGHLDTVEATLNAIETDTSGILTSVQLLDDAVTSDGAVINGTKLIMVGGFDGTNAQFISTTANGHVNIADGGNTITVDGTITANLGTIAGVATETTLASVNGKLAALGQKTMTGSMPVVIASNQSAIPVTATDLDIRNLTAVDVVTVNGGANQVDDVKVSLDGEQVTIANFPANQVVSGTVSVNPLPAGTNNIGDVDIASLPAPLNVTGAGAAANALRVQLAAESLAALEQIEVTVGSVTITNTTANPVPVSADALPLPTGAATAAKQDTMITSLQLLDDVVATAGTTALTKGYQIAGTDGTSSRIISTSSAGFVHVSDGGDSLTVDGTVAATQSGTWNITDITGAISLPTGAATETTLSAVNTKLPASIGQKTTANSLAVTIASDQSAVPASQSGTWNINNISGTVSLPTGAATDAKQDTIIGHLDGVEGLLTTIDADTGNIVTAIQILDNAVTTHDSASPTNSFQISGFASSTAPTAVASGDAARIWTTTSGAINIADGGSSITVDGTITANLGTIAGVATETTLSALNTKVPTQGQKTMTGSLPVVISSDQSAVPVSGTVTANIGTTNGLALNTTVDSLLKPASTLNAVTTLGSITNTVVIKADTAANQAHALKVDGSAVTQPISGSVSISGTPTVSVNNFPATQVVSATDLDIRNLTSSDVVTVTGGAGQTTDIKVSLDGEQVSISNFPATQVISGTVSVNSLPAGNNNIGDVDIASLPAPLNIVGVGAAASALRVQLADESLTALENISVTVTNSSVEITNDVGNPIPISATALPLPTGAATSNKQDTIIGHLDGVEGLLTTINADTGSILTSVQLLDDVVATDGAAALTKAYQIAGTDGTNAQIISTNASGHVNIADGGNSITVDGTVAATQSGTWNITDVSGTISLPTGASTSANQTNGTQRTQLTNGTSNVAATNTVPGASDVGLVVRNIPSGTQAISGTVDVGNFPASLSVVGSGEASSALRVQLSDESLAAFANLNVTLTSNLVSIENESLAVTQSGTWNISSITNPLPAGDNNIGNVDIVSLPGTVQADIGAIKTAVEATNAKTTGPVALRFDNAADPVAYKGEATAGTATSAASWRISRITTANDGSVTIEWADGNTNFDNIWNNRTSLSYS